MATATIDITCSVQDTKATDLGSYSGNPRLTQSASNVSVTKVFTDARTTAVPETLDLTTGLTDAYGAALVYSSCKYVCIQNTHVSATLTIGGGANPLFGTDQYTIKPGATLPITSTFAVAGGSKNLLVTPSASCTYSIIIAGV